MKRLLQVCLWFAVPALAVDDPRVWVERSLPFLRQEGLAWIDKRDCASCHQVPAMLWSWNLATKAGIAGGDALVREWTPWAADWRHWNQTGDKEGVDKVSAGNVDTMNFLLLGRAVNEAGAWVAEFRERLLKNQQVDGSWKPGGQLPLGKRPARETAEVTTQWTLLALASCEEPVPEEVRQKAEAYLVAAVPGVSTEWHALRLLRQPEDPSLRVALVKWQKPEGGWGWRVDEPGDAFGTGLAVYALARAGVAVDDPVLQRARAFLQSTQAADGSWPVPSTRARDKNKINKTATYWGTAWAVIGLLEAGMPGKAEGRAKQE
jgi:squalene-hopene/tetraprenyl-beta-curcumene cyclase